MMSLESFIFGFWCWSENLRDFNYLDLYKLREMYKITPS